MKMQSTSYYSGQPVLLEDLERDQTGWSEAIGSHFTDIVHSGIRAGYISTGWNNRWHYAGIIHSLFDSNTYEGSYDFKLTLNTTDNTKFDVGKVILSRAMGTAYDGNGNMIILTEDASYNSTNPFASPPLSTGNIGISLNSYVFGTVNYIYIHWIEARNLSVTSIHPIDGNLQYIGRVDGYEIIINTTAPATYLALNPNYIYIGYVIGQGVGVSISGQIYQDTANRRYLGVDSHHVMARTPVAASSPYRTSNYEVNKIVTLDDHIRAFGTGSPSTINPHGLTLSDLGGAGAVSGQHNSTHHSKYVYLSLPTITSGFYCVIFGANDVNVYPTIIGEYAYVFDKIVTDVTSPVGVQTISFVGEPVGTYYIYINASVYMETSHAITYGKVITANPENLTNYILTLYSVYWDGAALSALTDMRRLGASIATKDIQSGVDVTFSGITLTASSGIVNSIAGVFSGSEVILTPGTDAFDITKGTASLNIRAGGSILMDPGASLQVYGGLKVMGDTGILAYSGTMKALTISDTSAINQNVTTAATPTFVGVNLSSPVTREESLHPADFVGTLVASSISLKVSSLTVWQYGRSGIHLPPNAVVTSVKLYYYKVHASVGITVELERNDGVGGSVVMSSLSVGADITGYQTLEDTSIASATIDNSIYSYDVKIGQYVALSGDNGFSTQVVIAYTISSLPS